MSSLRHPLLNTYQFNENVRYAIPAVHTGMTRYLNKVTGGKTPMRIKPGHKTMKNMKDMKFLPSFFFMNFMFFMVYSSQARILPMGHTDFLLRNRHQ